jgi:uncharacterized membrane protein
MPDAAAFCPGCGRPMQNASPARGKVGILPESIAGALGYFTFIPATFFLAVSPYNQNRFVRFHSLQCLFFTLACLLIGVAIKLASLILLFIPVLGPLLVSLTSIVAALAAVVLWLVLVVKALQGEMFMLPVLGDLAENQAGLIPGQPS